MDKKQELQKFAEEVFAYQGSKQTLELLLRKFNLRKEDVIKKYIESDIDVEAYSDEIYESIETRVVLYMHNLLKRSWHQDRQKVIQQELEKIKPTSVLDIGFGVPTKYVKEYCLPNNVKVTLADLYQSALDFSEIILQNWQSNDSWKEIVSLQLHDMDKGEPIKGNFDTYIFQDSIEHTKDPTKYLNRTVQSIETGTNFIFSLPIGPIVPSHHINWNSDPEAIRWLEKSGLKVNYMEQIRFNPQVDLFAREYPEFYNLVVNCKK